MSLDENMVKKIRSDPGRWLVTGVAGFIGSNLLEALLKLDQEVVGLDNFATGYQHNLDKVRDIVSDQQWARFTMMEADICDLGACEAAVKGVDYVLHQAALGSVPRSIENPLRTHDSNNTGFLNMLVAVKDAPVKRMVYAASSSTYGDHEALPKVEQRIGNPLSPYAVTKYVNELYSDVFARCYGVQAIGLRYFNVFGPRQDPDGAYAAVIPKWFAALLRGEQVFINGDGETSRDFCYVANAVQANLLAAVTTSSDAINQVYNVAVGDRTSLNQLFFAIRDRVAVKQPALTGAEPVYRDFRPGDVRHSQADVSKAAKLLEYRPTHDIHAGLDEASDWYIAELSQ